MDGRNALDPIDQNILRIVSLYENLDLLQLWYELGESHGSVGRITEEEILERLKFLGSEGLVEATTESQGGTRWALTLKGEVER